MKEIDLGNGYSKQVSYYKSDKPKEELYYLNGKSHREDGPAVVRYFESGKRRSERWGLNGKLHREDGPAVVRYFELGKVQSEAYYLNGDYLRKDEFEQRMLVKKFSLI